MEIGGLWIHLKEREVVFPLTRVVMRGMDFSMVFLTRLQKVVSYLVIYTQTHPVTRHHLCFCWWVVYGDGDDGGGEMNIFMILIK
jgi:hypothetical protein